MTWKPFKPPTDVELAAREDLRGLCCVQQVMRELAKWAA